MTRHDTARTLRRLALLSAFLGPPAASAQTASPAPAQEPWRLIQPPQASLVLSRDGALIGEIGREIRSSVSIASLPRYVSQAFVAIEDQRFYEHDGVDVVGVLGALKDAAKGDPRGASTITQQLVGNMHPEIIDRRDKGLGRKIREQHAAREMEKHYNKSQILEAYLNQIPFGHGWHGIEAASRHYFGKPAARLTLAEAATLAAMPRSPAYYDPARHPHRARPRRDLVLGLMAQQKFITPAEAAAARALPVTTVPDNGLAAPSGYFVDLVRGEATRAGIAVTGGGYRIYTTLEPALQRAAVGALLEGLTAVEDRAGYRHPKYADRARGARAQYLQGAVVAIDPFTGDVRALVGGRNHQEAPFDRATRAIRQPGSAFKPLVYAAAIASGITANAAVADTSITIPLENGTIYSPGNADGEFAGPLTVREALVRSRNPVAVQLALAVGMDTVAHLARRLGITAPIPSYPSSAIGATAVKPIELVAAYAAFANLGRHVQPRSILRIEDARGRTVWSSTPPSADSVLDPRAAFITRSMMEDVVSRGTAAAVRRTLSPAIPAAGKTGTTNDNADVWFVGLTPDLVAGVWIGFDTPKPIMRGAAGGTLAAPLWARMMALYHASEPLQRGGWDIPPAGVVAVEIDRVTGEPATDLTPPEQRAREWFLEGTEPGALPIDPWSLFRWGPIGY